MLDIPQVRWEPKTDVRRHLRIFCQPCCALLCRRLRLLQVRQRLIPRQQWVAYG